MNLWPLSDAQAFRLTAFIIILTAIIIPIFLFTLRKEGNREDQRKRQDDFERLRIKRKRT